MDKLILPQGCIVEGSIESIKYGGDIELHTHVLTPRIVSGQGSIRVSMSEADYTGTTLSAPEGRFEAEVSSLQLETIEAGEVDIQAEHLVKFNTAQVEGAMVVKGERLEANLLEMASGDLNVQTISVPSMVAKGALKMSHDQGDFQVDKITAESIEVRGLQIGLGDVELQGECVIEALGSEVPSLRTLKSGNLTLKAPSLNCDVIQASGEVTLEFERGKIKELRAKTLRLAGGLECDRLIVEEKVEVTSGFVNIRQLECPEFFAEPDVMGIVMVANTDKVVAQGVRGFLRPDEVSFLSSNVAEEAPAAAPTPVSEAAPEPEPAVEAVAAEAMPEPAPAVEATETEAEPEVETVEAPAEPAEEAVDVVEIGAEAQVSSEDDASFSAETADTSFETPAEEDYDASFEAPVADVAEESFETPTVEFPEAEVAEAAAVEPEAFAAEESADDEEIEAAVDFDSGINDSLEVDPADGESDIDNPWGADTSDTSEASDIDDTDPDFGEESDIADDVEVDTSSFEVTDADLDADNDDEISVTDISDDDFDAVSEPEAIDDVGDNTFESVSDSLDDVDSIDDSGHFEVDAADLEDFDDEDLSVDTSDLEDLPTVDSFDEPDDFGQTMPGVQESDLAAEPSSPVNGMEELISDDLYNVDDSVSALDAPVASEETSGVSSGSGGPAASAEVVDFSEEEMAKFLSGEMTLQEQLDRILAQIKNLFPDDNYPKFIDQIQNYVAEERFTILIKSRNKEAVMGSFNKLDHPEITRLATAFYDTLEAGYSG